MFCLQLKPSINSSPSGLAVCWNWAEDECLDAETEAADPEKSEDIPFISVNVEAEEVS